MEGRDTLGRELIKSRYQVLAALGAGGEGRVVKALDRQHDRIVALKIRQVRDDRTREDLLNEARVLLAVPPHAALPLVREDFFEGDTYVVAMDWVDGTDLATLLAERGRPGLAPSSVLTWLAQAAEALTHLHAQDPPVIHGDVKPGNLILTKGGRVKLVDFGMSSAPEARRRRSGTPGYRAPELAADGPPSRASDVYALAATGFALLTGGPPSGVLPRWEGVDPEQAAQLEAALRLGLATDPAHRPPTPGELVERLRSGWGAALPTGVMTFCMSDIVGSTALWERDPSAMAEALVRHDEIIASHVEAHGGRFLKSKGEGDSTVSVFESAPRALEAALGAGRALAAEPWPDGVRIVVRFGLHTGEAERRDDDYFGPTLNLAARLRGQADGGQVFLSSTTAGLVAARLPEGCALVDLGPHRLRGLGAPERIHAVSAPGIDAPLPATESPYRGLLAFEAGDRRFFFGRERPVQDVLARLAPGRLVAVIGASGSGKSSLLRAGVAAAVLAGEVDGLDHAVVTGPNAEPPAGGEGDERELLIVDQFEELYTLCDDEERRERFIDALLASRSAVAIGVRADLYGMLGGHEALATAVAANQVLLGAMGEADLRRAITEPARVAGLRLEPGLVDVILRDVAREPGALPLLSHALRVTWEQRDGRTLTVEGYRASGGVARALARTADAVVESVPPGHQRLVRNLFLRLTELGEGIEDTRRRVVVDELVPEGASPHEVQALLERLAEARLVTLGEGTAEVAHEVLIREWPTLRRWLEEDRAGIRLHRELGNAARLWAAGGRESGDVYRGTRLGAAVDWAERHPEALNATERAFLDAGVAESQRETARQRRMNRRLRALLAGAAVLLTLAVAAGVVALWQAANARDAARSEAAQRLGAEAVTVARLDRALRLATAGSTLEDSLATRSNLLRVLLRSPAAIGVLNGDGDHLVELATSSDGAFVALADADGTVTVFDGRTRRRIGAYRAELQVSGLEFQPGSDRLAITGFELGRPAGEGRARLEIIDAATARAVDAVAVGRHPAGPGVPHRVVATYAPDGRTLVVGYVAAEGPTFLRRFDAAGGAPLGRARRLRGVTGFLTDLLVLHDGRLLYVGQDATYAIDGATLRTTRRYGFGARAAAVNEDGSMLALGGEDGRVRLLDLESGRARPLRGRHLEPVLSAAFSPDGRRLATGAEAGGAIVWDVAGGRQVEALEGGAEDFVDQEFGVDGRTLYSASIEGRAIVWDVSGTRRLAARFPTGFAAAPPEPYPPPFSISPDGRGIAVARLDGRVDLIDARTLRTLRTFRAFDRAPATAIEYSPDGRQLAVGGGRGHLGVFEARTGASAGPLLHEPGGTCAEPAAALDLPACFEATIQALDFAGPGLLAAAGLGGAVRIWDLERRRPIRPPLRLPRFVVGLDVSPDGAKLAVPFGFVNSENSVEIVDVRTGRRIARLRTPGEPRPVTFSPDGRLLVTGLTNGTAVVWETARWRRAGGPLSHAGQLLAVHFSPDGRTLATSSTEGTVALWDVASRRQIGSPLPRVPDRGAFRLPGPERWVTARFTPDGSRLFAVYENGHAARWELDPARWRRHACAVAGGGLTRGEWTEAVPEQDYRRICP